MPDNPGRDLRLSLKEKGRAPFDYVIVDKAQSLSVAQSRFLAAFRSGATAIA